jgi:hypothetical protein
MNADEAADEIASRALMYAFLFDVPCDDVALAVIERMENCRHEFKPDEQIKMARIVVKAVQIIIGRAA